MSDAVLAEYITQLHRVGEIAVHYCARVAAVKWQAKNMNRSDIVGAVTERTLAGIRREGKDRGRGQVDGLTWKEVGRVCSFAEASRTLAGLRDSALIVLMSDYLLRISEVVAVNVGDIKGSTLYLKSSKTDQEGVGESLYICESTRRVIKRYLRKSDIKRGSLSPESEISKIIWGRGGYLCAARGMRSSGGLRKLVLTGSNQKMVTRSLRGVCGVACSCGSKCCGYADGGQMEICGHAGALCKGRTGRTGRGARFFYGKWGEIKSRLKSE